MDNFQIGPPGSADLLREVVLSITYKPGWTLQLKHMHRHGEHLAGGDGLTLSVRLECEDSTKPGETVWPHHLFAVPPAAYNRQTWERWVLDCLIQVETHEALEFFRSMGGLRTFRHTGTRTEATRTRSSADSREDMGHSGADVLRAHPMFLHLLDQFEAQIRPGVRLLVARGPRDPEHMAEKQQALLEALDADYTCTCSDDALLHPEYVSLIHDAMQTDPDVIGFKIQLWNGGPAASAQAHSIAFHGIPQLVWPNRGA